MFNLSNFSITENITAPNLPNLNTFATDSEIAFMCIIYLAFAGGIILCIAIIWKIYERVKYGKFR